MSRSANKGQLEIGEDSIVHPGYPHIEVLLPLVGGVAFPEGAVLQMSETHALEAGDFTGRSYVAAEEIAVDAEEALVLAIGAVRTEKLKKANAGAFVALTAAEAIALMEKAPIVCA